MPITQPSDVASRLGRPLTPDEEAVADILLEDAENLVQSRFTDSLTDLITDQRFLANVVQVCASAVMRVFRNPEGYRSEAVGGVSYTIDTRAAAGFLTILDEEWRLLGLAPKAARSGSFGPKLSPAYAEPRWTRNWADWPEPWC